MFCHKNNQRYHTAANCTDAQRLWRRCCLPVAREPILFSSCHIYATFIASEDTVPFSDELERTRAYLAVEQVQFEDGLLVDCDTPYTNFRISPLTLQPLRRMPSNTAWIRSTLLSASPFRHERRIPPAKLSWFSQIPLSAHFQRLVPKQTASPKPSGDADYAVNIRARSSPIRTVSPLSAPSGPAAARDRCALVLRPP